MPQFALPSGPPLSNPESFVNWSASIGTTSTLLVPQATSTRRYLFICNVGAASGPTLWLCFNGAAVAGGAGSIPLGPYGNSAGHASVWEYGVTGGVVLPFAIYAVNDSTTSGTLVPITCWVA